MTEKADLQSNNMKLTVITKLTDTLRGVESVKLHEIAFRIYSPFHTLHSTQSKRDIYDTSALSPRYLGYIFWGKRKGKEGTGR